MGQKRFRLQNDQNGRKGMWGGSHLRMSESIGGNNNHRERFRDEKFAVFSMSISLDNVLLFDSTVYEITTGHRSLSSMILCVTDRIRFVPVIVFK